MPFSSDKTLRAQYINAFDHIRIGKLLEDLDALAGNVSYLHSDDNDPNTRPHTVVTASIDKLDLIPSIIDPRKDIKLKGFVTFENNKNNFYFQY